MTMCSRVERIRRWLGSFLDVSLHIPTPDRICEAAAAMAFRWNRGVSDDARRFELLGWLLSLKR